MADPGSGKTFDVAVVSPQKLLFEGPARYVVVPAHDGQLGILSNHAPLMALLGDGQLRVETSMGTLRFSVAGGFVQVVNNRVSVLSEEAAELE